MQALQEEIAKRKVEATAGGGMVTVEANGKQELLSIKIDPEVINKDDAQMLEELQEGELVKLEFVHERDGWLIRSIEAADAGGEPSDTEAE